MVAKDDMQSVESLGEKQSVPSRSRRGFLKQTAAVGILGMTGMSAATESASASETTGALSEAPDPVRTIEVTDSVRLTNVSGPIHFKIRRPSSDSGGMEQNSNIGTMDYRGFDKKVKIIGNSLGWTNYNIDSNGDIIKAEGCESSDWTGNDVAGGEVYGYGWDAFYVQYGVDLITDSSGDVNYEITEV